VVRPENQDFKPDPLPTVLVNQPDRAAREFGTFTNRGVSGGASFSSRESRIRPNNPPHNIPTWIPSLLEPFRDM
jgi:hypothetical protein